MAWFRTNKTNKDLIESLKSDGYIKSSIVERVMLAVDRANYTKTSPYMDTPQMIGFGATISAPHMHAFALEYLKDHLEKGGKALDVGSGSGYLTACMALMLGPSGKVVGVDHIHEMVQMSFENISRDQPGLIESGRVKLFLGDGRLGHSELAPYQAIHVGAGAAVVPQPLVEQLQFGGRIVIPVGPSSGQTLEVIDKDEEGRIKRTQLIDVKFVPLTDKERQYR